MSRYAERSLDASLRVVQIDLAKNGDQAVLRVKEAEASFRKARVKAQKARKRRAKAEAKSAAAGDAGDASADDPRLG